mgnify:CR=1 FL=1
MPFEFRKGDHIAGHTFLAGAGEDKHMGTPGGGPAGDFRKAGRQPAFRAPDRAGMQPEQDGFLIALPERLAEGAAFSSASEGSVNSGQC